jgi:hypothetical protein
MIIDQRSVSIMSTLFTNRRVTHLRFVDAFEWTRNTGGNIGHHRDCFEKYSNCFGVDKSTNTKARDVGTPKACSGSSP